MTFFIPYQDFEFDSRVLFKALHFLEQTEWDCVQEPSFSLVCSFSYGVYKSDKGNNSGWGLTMPHLVNKNLTLH